MPAVAVGPVGAERGDLDRDGPVVQPRANDVDDTEAHADGDRAAEELAHLFGPRGGGDVVVFGCQAEQPIAHATAGPKRLVTGVVQTAHHIQGKGALGFGVRHVAILLRC